MLISILWNSILWPDPTSNHTKQYKFRYQNRLILIWTIYFILIENRIGKKAYINVTKLQFVWNKDSSWRSLFAQITFKVFFEEVETGYLSQPTNKWSQKLLSL
jgi:hypothetical protein